MIAGVASFARPFTAFVTYYDYQVQHGVSAVDGSKTFIVGTHTFSKNL